MDLRTYLRAIRKNWWIILGVTVLGALAATVYTARSPEIYRSSVTFYASTPVIDSSGNSGFQADQYAQRQVASYVKIATSDQLARRIRSDAGLSISIGQIESMISASADLNTVLMTVNVDDTSKARSLEIAQAVATQFPGYVKTLGDSSVNTIQLTVTSGPTAQSAPIAPRGSLNIAAGVGAGLVLGIILALLRELLDTTVRTVDALRDLTGLPVLGAVPLDKQAKAAPIISQSGGHSVRAEAFRQIRTSIQFTDARTKTQVLEVTSSVAGEGKSSTSANLALTFAETGMKVLLVEADLRRPKVADYMSLDRSAGLTNVLVGQVELAEVLQPWGSSGMTLLASGSIPPNPSELLGGASMRELVAELRTMFDIIVIDTPPLVPVTDGAIMSTYADGVVLVARAAKTSRQHIRTALDALDAVDARVLGCILNMVPRRRVFGRNSDSYAYYDSTVAAENAAPLSSTAQAENVLGFAADGVAVVGVTDDEVAPGLAAPVVVEPMVVEPVAVEPVVVEPVVVEPVVVEPVAVEPALAEPADVAAADESDPTAPEQVLPGDESVPPADEPEDEPVAAEEPVVEEPVGEPVVDDEPVDEPVAAEEPVVEEPVGEPVVDDEPADEPVVSDESATEPFDEPAEEPDGPASAGEPETQPAAAARRPNGAARQRSAARKRAKQTRSRRR